MKFFPSGDSIIINPSDKMSTFTSVRETLCVHRRDVLADDNHSLLKATVNSSKLVNSNFLANTNDDHN